MTPCFLIAPNNLNDSVLSIVVKVGIHGHRIRESVNVVTKFSVDFDRMWHFVETPYDPMNHIFILSRLISMQGIKTLLM